MILFSFFIMITGFFSYWLRGWAITGVFLLLLILNYAVKNNYFDTTYKAHGLNYKNKPAEYSLNRIYSLTNIKNYLSDYESTLKILNNWRSKFPEGKKPKMVFLCVSGGGQRAAVWSFRTLQVLDTACKGRLFPQTILITGASGGMIGAALFREYYLRKQLGTLDVPLYSEKLFDNIAKDVLNPVAFTFVVNDLFLRSQSFTFGGQKYIKDRGYAFERQLNLNSGGVLWKPLSFYKDFEKKSIIPMMIISPTIVNDGRKLYISAQPISYMCSSSLEAKTILSNQRLKGIEFSRFFENQQADSLSFLSALRMSATFPYITPTVTLPSYPEMEIMDAGLADNFGFTDAIKFLHVFKDWIAENTSGVILVSIRDSKKELEIEKKISHGILQKLFIPVGSLYTSWDNFQDINNDNLVEYAKSWFKNSIQVIDFQYIPKPKYWNDSLMKNLDLFEIERIQKRERASLSWHLTNREKESLKRTIFESNNIVSIKKLKQLLNE